MATKIWQNSGDGYFLRDISDTKSLLQNFVYSLEKTPLGELYLKKISDSFDFNFKIYGLENEFINKVLKTYKNTKGNLGILLNGIKGTGKTITAEMIANELKLPVILIQNNQSGLNTFLAEIEQDCVILIDEYEKVFKGNVDEDDYDRDVTSGDPTLLSLMDGVLKTEFRKVFLLTTNRSWLNENLLNRPGRIRYKKEFGDLNINQINEIIDDCLKFPKFKEQILSFIKPLKIITVDIVKAIVSEINIHKEEPNIACKDFNLEFKDTSYNVYDISNSKETLLLEDIREREVSGIIDPKTKNAAIRIYDETYLKNDNSVVDYSTMIFKLENYRDKKQKKTIRIEKASKIHNSFVF